MPPTTQSYELWLFCRIVVLLGEKNHRCSPDFALLFTVPIFLPILGQHVQFRVPVHLLFIL